MVWSSRLIFILLLLASGCGVKSDPAKPQDTIVPSYVNKFIAPSGPDDEVKDSQVKKPNPK